jgi:hypothetical protein
MKFFVVLYWVHYLCWSTDLRVRAELALAQNKRTAHCIYRVEEHFSRTTDFMKYS